MNELMKWNDYWRYLKEFNAAEQFSELEILRREKIIRKLKKIYLLKLIQMWMVTSVWSIIRLVSVLIGRDVCWRGAIECGGANVPLSWLRIVAWINDGLKWWRARNILAPEIRLLTANELADGLDSTGETR